MRKGAQRYFDREISWLRFNARVLQEAADKNNPLNERMKFLGIFSNNQDEFFRVRVASLYRLISYHEKQNSEEADVCKNDLVQVIKEIREQQVTFGRIYVNIISQLAKHNIFLINEEQLDEEQGQYVRKYFNDKVRHHLFPIILSNFKASANLADQSIYLAIILERIGLPDKKSYAIMEIPTGSVDRFLVLPEKNGRKFIIVLDDVIRFCLDEIFSRFKYDKFEAFTFKFTRDAEMDIDNDVSKSFMEVMSKSLEQRKRGTALRFVYDRKMPEDILKALISKFKIKDKHHIAEGGRYHNFKDFMGFPNLGGPELEYAKVKPVPHKDIHPGSSVIKSIRNRDILLHYPYQPFHYIVELMREASIDPRVKSIKMTLYRVSNPSNIINSLINAARNGKKVTVFLELQARFDEEANIYWSEVLQREGVVVMKGIPGLKVHSKLILIKRREDSGDMLYANIGTGNFHEKTGALYTDKSLLTCNPKITKEVEKVFGLFTMSFRPSRFSTLVVSPFSTRNFFLKLLSAEIKNAKAGKKAWAIIKLNSLSDIRLINKMYQASRAGVKIDLIIRGICKLVPGVKGLSENIRVISILDKYLEHSRVMIFCNGGDEKYFISSADWMIRNLDNRIEVTTPIFDPQIKKELKEMLQIQLKDNTKARIIDTEMTNQYVTNKQKETRTQVDTYKYLKSIHSPKK